MIGEGYLLPFKQYRVFGVEKNLLSVFSEKDYPLNLGMMPRWVVFDAYPDLVGISNGKASQQVGIYSMLMVSSA
jgi:hypothetical protein